MLAHAREAIELCQTRSRAELDQQRLVQLSLVRLLEIVGEAARRVPEETQLRHPEILWRQIIGLRNRLIHGYDAIDFDIMWATVTIDLPPLVEMLEHLLSTEEQNRKDKP